MDNIKIDLEKEKNIAQSPGNAMEDIFKNLPTFVTAIEVNPKEINKLIRSKVGIDNKIDNINMVQFIPSSKVKLNKLRIIYNNGKSKEVLIEAKTKTKKRKM